MRAMKLAQLLVAASFSFACSTQAEHAAQYLVDRLKYPVPFKCCESKQGLHGDAISISEVWGTRPALERGGLYLIRGHYSLLPYPYASSWVSARPPEPGETSDVDLEVVIVSEGTGEFSILYAMREFGDPFVSLTLLQGHMSSEVAKVRLTSKTKDLQQSP